MAQHVDSASSAGSDGKTQTHSHQNDYDELNHSNTNPSRSNSISAAERARRNVSAKLANPLAGKTHAELEFMGEEYARKHQVGDEEDIRAFQKGAVLAQDPAKYSTVAGLTAQELEVLEKEFTSRWSQPKILYIVIVLCSTCAAVQGMGQYIILSIDIVCANTMIDETVVNGGQLFYRGQFGIGGEDSRSTWLTGLLNSAPYLCSAFIGCWLTVPFNNIFGRRGTIFITCLYSATACFWQGFTNTWWHMFVARFFLGFGIGPKSATVPIFAAESTPPGIRGALVMQWQMVPTSLNSNPNEKVS